MGSAAGQQSKTLLTANLPAYTPSGTITNGAITFPSSQVTSVASGANAGMTTGPSSANANLTTILSPAQATTTFAGAAQGGTSTPVATVQPTIVCNYIIRII
jgi:microcystin-dependent protein